MVVTGEAAPCHVQASWREGGPLPGVNSDDELDWGERVKKNPKLLPQRKRKGYKIHELFSHAILKGASGIRFASAIPGIHQIIAVFPLLKEAIRIVSGGGGSSENFEC